MRASRCSSSTASAQAQDTTWEQQSYDACRTDMQSMNMEWCVRNPSQVRVVDVERYDGKHWVSSKDDKDLQDLSAPRDAMQCPNCRSSKVTGALQAYGDGDMAKGQEKLPEEQWGWLLCQACNLLWEPEGYSISPPPCRPRQVAAES